MMKIKLEKGKKTVCRYLLAGFLLAFACNISGCGSDSSVDETTDNMTENAEQKDNEEVCENIQQFFISITDDILNACERYPSSEAYWNDGIVLLNQFDEDVRLYGISMKEQTAMLLYIEGEKILIESPFPEFRNLYEEKPKLNVLDIDDDGEKEVLISVRTITGSIRRYAMLVCDCEEEWNIYMYHNYLEDVQSIIQYGYDDQNDRIVFSDVNDNVLWEGKLPEWTMGYAYAGTVNFENNMGFDAETVQLDIIPQIELENSLPYEPVQIVFTLGFMDGHFKITGYDIQMIEETETEEIPSLADIAGLGIPEDMLAYWMVLSNKKPFISKNEGGQQFFLNEYFWYLKDVEVSYSIDHFIIVDMDGDGAEEVVLQCTPGTS